ncbi:hypothetical protein GGD68_005423 [Paraburkholderia fungorum]|uniref:Thiol:disulfide interchange protein DsbD N-terminal domain-containing protein n=2 Tax=Paraburkholderia fungorum TaxID=134537 RepID=A0AAW3V308_9BURK|nr:hypothetical protein [Paraburkholderia fungorum]MBB5545118.1 hypothetical protein [Paraburkholderia fungorum]MBB6204903.1 hypothetical protein [Paraburkholderia fungorum]MBU7442489.1 protein-disulfide reductase DsbD N-terminal domain-containing protein [Paraburkholderia fungorum]QLD53981.1 disulfide bond formation protein DsbD [Paraburkholderia fungorum]
MNMKSRTIKISFALALLAAATILAWSRYPQFRNAVTPGDAVTQNSPSLTLSGASGGGIGDSSQQVTASFENVGAAAAVTLHIRPNWHVNANPASLDYLIPTTISVEQGGDIHPVAAQYPAGMNSGIRVDDKELNVYEDGTRIPVSDLPNGPNVHLIVRVQACSSDGVCLPPANIPAPMSMR